MKSLSKIDATKGIVKDNAIEILTQQNKTYSFISFSVRDIAYKRITSIFKAYKTISNRKIK